MVCELYTNKVITKKKSLGSVSISSLFSVQTKVKKHWLLWAKSW